MDEYSYGDKGPFRSELRKDIGGHIVVPRDVVELKTVEPGLKFANHPVVGVHFLFGSVPILIHLLNDDFGVAIREEALDAECDSDPETVYKSLVLDSIVCGLEM